MPKEQIVASLDVGSSKIRTVIAIVEEEKKMPNIIGVGVSPSTGMRKGNIVDVDETISNISAALEDAERMSGAPIHHVFVGVSGSNIESFDSKGVIAISHAGSEIIEDDIDRVLEAAQAVSMPSNRRILRIIPKSFSVDDQRGIKNPVGMIGVRLEVDAHIITGQATAIQNLERAVHQAGVDIDVDVVFRDFAPLDSINQVAGRCNRNYVKDEKGLVKVFILKDDNKNFYRYIYSDDVFLIEQTKEILKDNPIVDEKQFLEFNNRYFLKIKELGQKDQSKKILKAAIELKFKSLQEFRLIEEDYPKVDIFVEYDLQAKVL